MGKINVYELYWVFVSSVGRKEDEYVIWKLIYELCISYELLKGNIKVYKLVSIYCIQ